jgi:hypothetical protein
MGHKGLSNNDETTEILDAEHGQMAVDCQARGVVTDCVPLDRFAAHNTRKLIGSGRR